jgi:pyruvate-formate lyase-activating enzyme
MTIGQFSELLSSEFPSQINVDLTEYCNLACTHCPYVSTMKPKGKTRSHLSEKLHRKMVDEIVSHGLDHCRFIRYTGEGEPLMHPNLVELLADASERTKLPINLTTNGLLLTEKRIRELLDAGVGTFDVSLDAVHAATYAAIRIGGDLAEVRENTQRLIRLAHDRNRQVIVSFVRQPENDGEADQFKAFWEAEGADVVVLRRLHSCAGYFRETANAMWLSAPSQRRPCLYPWERLVVKPQGTLAFCPASWQHEADIADLATTTIRETWKGPRMTALRTAHVSGDYAQHAFCGQCPDWSVMHWPHEGPNYASVMAQLKKERTT